MITAQIFSDHPLRLTEMHLMISMIMIHDTDTEDDRSARLHDDWGCVGTRMQVILIDNG